MELPNFITTTNLSATTHGPACPSRESSCEFCCCEYAVTSSHRDGFPCCVVDPFDACRHHYPGGTAECCRFFLRSEGLRQVWGGSASATLFSRPARCSPEGFGLHHRQAAYAALYTRYSGKVRYLPSPPDCSPAVTTRPDGTSTHKINNAFQGVPNLRKINP